MKQSNQFPEPIFQFVERCTKTKYFGNRVREGKRRGLATLPAYATMCPPVPPAPVPPTDAPALGWSGDSVAARYNVPCVL